jgi:hypothetical protein
LRLWHSERSDKQRKLAVNAVVLEFKPDGEHGPRFRAPYSGYSLIQVDSNPKSTFLLRDLAAA